MIYVVVIDCVGNVVIMIYLLGMLFGVIMDGLGFMYNGCMVVFDFWFGWVGFLVLGKSCFLLLCFMIVFKGDNFYIVVGVFGGM